MGAVLECCGLVQEEDLSPLQVKALGMENEDSAPPPPQEIRMNVLNKRKDTMKKLDSEKFSAVESVETSHKFNKALMSLKENYWEEDGINYTGIKGSPEFKQYLEIVPDLDLVDLGVMSPNEKKAFLINIYNALVIHATVVQGQPKNRPERQKFFQQTSYQIGEYTYCLKDIEHGMLRGNVIHPKTGKPNLEEGDPRLKFALKMDPRIHFALVCGGKSCPPVRFWKTETVDDDLERAAQSFVHHEVEVLEDDQIAMNQILSWYRKDFTGDDEDPKALLNSLRKWMDDEQKEDIDELENPTILFKKYDWSLNGH